MIQTIDISLIPSDNKPVINVSQFDNVSRVLRFNVFDDLGMETPHVFDNTETVLLNIRKNDNNIVVITGEIITETDPETQEVTGYYLTFELTEQACACVGSNYGEVSITSGDDEVIGSCNFKLIVERSPLAGGVSSQTAIDNLTTQIEEITEEVIGENYYTKTETDNLLSGKADANNVYTKTETNNLLSGKANANSVYTKTETDNLLNAKANANSVYTKTETDNLLAAIIDDSQTVNNKTWSSSKISDELYALLPVGSASGSIANFNTALAKPLVSCVVDENATKLTKCGSNLWDEEWELGGLSSSTGNPSYDTDRIRSKNFCRCEPNASVYKYIGTSDVYLFTYWYDENKNYINRSSSTLQVSPANAYYFKIMTYSGNYTTYLNDISINYPASITTYSQYKHVNYELPLQTMPETYAGDNNFFTDYGDITIQYKDTIQNYIDTRVNNVAIATRSALNVARTLLERSDNELERGENNENER